MTDERHTPLSRADWFAATAATFWQYDDGADRLAALCAAKVPTGQSPETPEELAAWLDAYLAKWGLPSTNERMDE